MSKVTRRQVIRAGVLASFGLGAATAHAGMDKEKPFPFLDSLLPAQLTQEDAKVRAAKDGTFAKVEFAGSTFWVGTINLGFGVSHTLIGIYAPDKEGVLHRSLFAESWAAGNIEARVDKKTCVLELRERANSKLKGQLVLACNLRTIGTQHSIQE